MKEIILLLVSSVAFGSTPAPYPVFLKAGFSSVLDFSEAPSRVVLGDSQRFQVERLDRSLVIKALAPYAATNMFVYFPGQEPKLFVLSASEDAEPTYYRRFESPIPQKIENKSNVPTQKIAFKAGTRVVFSQFDAKKDYLSVEIEITADSKETIRPTWGWVRLKYGGSALVPYKLWAQRQDIQKDSQIRARFIFAKPNIPRNLKGVSIIIPIEGRPSPISLALSRGAQ